MVATVAFMLHLLIGTSTWLDLAKRRDGQKLIVALASQSNPRSNW
jgi:hypothetical protein